MSGNSTILQEQHKRSEIIIDLNSSQTECIHRFLKKIGLMFRPNVSDINTNYHTVPSAILLLIAFLSFFIWTFPY